MRVRLRQRFMPARFPQMLGTRICLTLVNQAPLPGFLRYAPFEIFGLLLLVGCGEASQNIREEETETPETLASESQPAVETIVTPTESAEDASSVVALDVGCVAENPPNTPFDIGELDYRWFPSTPRTLETISQQCESYGGTRCDPTEFISLRAATCIVDPSIPAGESMRRLGLSVSESGRVEWAIEILYDDEDASCRGLLNLFVDAVSGTLSDRPADIIPICS